MLQTEKLLCEDVLQRVQQIEKTYGVCLYVRNIETAKVINLIFKALGSIKSQEHLIDSTYTNISDLIEAIKNKIEECHRICSCKENFKLFLGKNKINRLFTRAKKSIEHASNKFNFSFDDYKKNFLDVLYSMQEDFDMCKQYWWDTDVDDIGWDSRWDVESIQIYRNDIKNLKGWINMHNSSVFEKLMNEVITADQCTKELKNEINQVLTNAGKTL